MQSADIAPIPAAGGTRTITMGRNRLNSIENWVKPSRPRGAQAERALANRPLADRAAPGDPASPANADGLARAPENTAPPRPVSQFVRTTTLVVPR